ncbi:MAG TPA: hypothetical protein VFF73_08015 [Planctomycetota bacterium]|nr:hypothetical protein [Planctomycetota bacterium]
MDCKRFWELRARAKELDPTIRLALDAHTGACAGCRAEVEALEADDGPGVSDEVLKKEVAEILAMAGVSEPGETLRAPPTKIWLFSMAASLVLGLGVGIFVGVESRPRAIELPRETLSANSKTFWLAYRALEMGDQEDAHDLARKILASPDLNKYEKFDAEQILATKSRR